MPDNDGTIYADLINFLQSDRNDIRESAAEAALSVATDRNHRQNLTKYDVVTPLTRLITHPGKSGYNSLAALVHLTAADDVTARAAAEDILSCGGVNRVVEVGLSYDGGCGGNGDEEEAARHVNHAVSLLSNLTRSEDGAGRLLLPFEEEEKRRREGRGVSSKTELLVSRFFSRRFNKWCTEDDDADALAFSLEMEDEETDGVDDDNGARDPYQHVASVLRNVTQVEAGRRFVLSSSSSVAPPPVATTTRGNGAAVLLPPLFKSLLCELRLSPNPVRRRGAAGTIKNCCFESGLVRAWVLPLLNRAYLADDDDDLIFALLLPLLGPEEISDDDDRLVLGDILLSYATPEKVRERDAATRLSIVETILLLCAAGRRVREILRARGTYVVLKNADMVEEKEVVSERIEECVQFLRRDEEGTCEGSSDKAAVEMARQAKRNATREIEDYDDVD